MAFYELKLHPEDGAWLVEAPVFSEVHTFGDTMEDALRHGRLAIEEAIAGRIADSETIPQPLLETPGRGHFIELRALTFLKAALYMIMRDKGISRAELMRRLGWHREQVERLFRLDHLSRIDQMEAAFKAIGMPMRFQIPFPSAA